jgi:NAD(P)H-flavin reductase
MPFLPGQFTMLSRGGAGEVPISISGDPAEPGRLVHTVRAVGLATRAICAAEPGEVFGVRGPFGRPWPVDAAEGADVLVVCGGIGLAPLRPAVLQLLARQERYGRLLLLYGGRSPDQLLYPEELDAWSARGLGVAVTVDSAGPEWLGHVGVVPRLIRRASFDADCAVALLCGPEVMMRFAAGPWSSSACGPIACTRRWSATCSAGSACAGTASSDPRWSCRDGPVYRWDDLAPWLAVREL